MKTVLITGGTKGIGKAIAFAFLQQGYEVVINYHKDDLSAKETQEEFALQGYYPVVMNADVSNEEQVRGMFTEFFQSFGHLDVLVNNAGISKIDVLQNTTLDQWNRIFAVNMTGTFLCCRESIDHMIDNGGGCVINISSIWGQVGASCEVAYSASKGAVIAFTKALAKELAPSQVRVNCICPGVIATEMNNHLSQEEMQDLIEEIPLGRIGTGEDVAQACLYLANAPYVTGDILSVGGGFAK